MMRSYPNVSMLTTLFTLQARRMGRFFSRDRVARSLTALVFISIIVLLSVGIYALFVQGLLYIASFPPLRDAVSLYIYEIILFTLGGLIFASALISSTLRLFAREYDFWVIATPAYPIFTTYTGLGIFLSSIWPLLVIGIPTLAALTHVYAVTLLSWIVVVVGLGLVGVAATALALAIILGSLRVLRTLRIVRLSLYLSLIISALCVVGGGLFWLQVRTISTATILFPSVSDTTMALSLNPIRSQFMLMPTHPAAELLYAAQVGDTQELLTALGMLFLVTLATLVMYYFASIDFLPTWQALQERARAATHRSKGAFSYTARRAEYTLLQHEALTFFRSQKNLLWVCFLGLLWFLQISFDIVSHRSSVISGMAISSLSATIQVLQVVSISYFISIFVLRFVFPAFSMERNTAWFIGSMPVSLRAVYRAKLAFYTLALLTFTIVAVVLHAFLLALSIKTTLLFLLLCTCTTITTVILGLTLGVVFPNFDTSDADELSTSLPGLTFIVSSLLYGSVGALALRSFVQVGIVWPLALFIVSSGISTLVLYRLSLHTLKRFEFLF